MECGNLFFDYSPEKTAFILLAEIKKQLSELSKKSNKPIESFASTLCFACLEKKTNRLMTFQLGDSNLYLISENGCRFSLDEKAVPQAFTVYEDADEKAAVSVCAADGLNAVLLCSDGAWREFYEKGDFNKELYEALKRSDFFRLKSFLEERSCADDCSYILMNFNKNKAA